MRGTVNWRGLAKAVLPPVVSRWGRPGPPRHVWVGVYASRQDVPAVRDEYGGELIDEMVATTSTALREVKAGRKPFLWHESLALLAGAASAGGTLRVIDFGGGVGSGFVQLLSSLPATTELHYLVVDSPEMNGAGRRIFDGDRRITFAPTLPPSSAPIDIVYLNGVLPYIDDYRALLRQLTSLQPRFVLLARLAAGEVPTFASGQINIPGRVFPYWFLNFNELSEIMAASAYRLASHGLSEHQYDLSNLPETHRIGRFRTVLFARE